MSWLNKCHQNKYTVWCTYWKYWTHVFLSSDCKAYFKRSLITTGIANELQATYMFCNVSDHKSTTGVPKGFANTLPFSAILICTPLLLTTKTNTNVSTSSKSFLDSQDRSKIQKNSEARLIRFKWSSNPLQIQILLKSSQIFFYFTVFWRAVPKFHLSIEQYW